jgi:hypothetical protein
MPSSVQPAVKGYFFDKGWKDIGSVTNITFSEIGVAINRQTGRMRAGSAWLWIYHISVIISVAVFGGIFCFIFTVAHSIIAFLFMLLYYILFMIVMIVDRSYLVIREISISCYECKSKFMYPVYICPSCRAKHDKLTPSIYGAFKRKCTCGKILPTSIFHAGGRRKDLEAHCPVCEQRGKITYLTDRESRPVCVPVVGGASVGKSAFITAYANLFIDHIALNKGVDVEFYNKVRESDFQVMKTHFRHGQIFKTAVQTDLSRASSIAFSFFVKHRQLKPERLIHIYDIAGETFTENTENELQKQYDYCDGIILLIDPFSIPRVMRQYGQKLNNTDKASTSNAGIDYIMGNFIIKLQETTRLSKSKLLHTPLAIVLSKIDQADLSLVIGDFAIKRVMANHGGDFKDYFDTMDFICREFLRKMDMGDVLSHIQMNFKNSRFFSASAIGHTLNQGRYSPHNVTPVFDWILATTDPKLAALVSEFRFSKEKLPIKSTIETIL